MKFREHIIFWSILLILLTLLFAQGAMTVTKSFYFVCLLLPVAIGTSWFFNDFLVPNYLLKGHYVKFGLYFIYSMVLSLWAQMMVITLSFILLANYSLGNMNPLASKVEILALTIYGIVFLQAFLSMYRKFMAASRRAEKLNKEQENLSRGTVTVRADRKQHQIAYDDILYIESLSDYIRFALDGKKPITTRESISKMEKELPPTFVRIHRSFIVRKAAIDSFTREEVRIGEHTLPVGRKFKELFIKEVSS